ncbi:MAG: IclR family transcriptional regulator [Armatimonadetes bacterium]|nr:IclR family transcriptional regulator [Armatimonadota bacterium]
MIQSLHRAFDILEFLARRGGEPLALGDIARHTGLNASTCANLLKTLVSRSYVDQAGPRQGYVLGPMAQHLGRAGGYRGDLVQVAEPLLVALAADVHENVVLSALHQDRLFELARAEGDSLLQLRRDLQLVESVYRAANGRVLLAYLAEGELEGFVARRGLPGEAWPGVESPQGLKALLAATRAAGHYEDVREDGVARVSFPVWQSGAVVAALGLYAPAVRFVGEHRERALAAVAETAEEISRRVDGAG